MSLREDWSPSTWQTREILQQPEYSNNEALAAALRKVHSLPPVVHYQEVDELKNKLAQAGRGELFLLQGGDCAERFQDCTKDAISAKFKILLQMSMIVIWGSGVPVVRLARMAGQFAKPRSSPHEKLPSGESVCSFKGDNVNGFSVDQREPDPERLVQAYFHSVATLNYIRSMIAGGVADLHSAPSWQLDNILKEETRTEYGQIIDKMMEGLRFLRVIEADTSPAFRSVSLYTSHEGLLLNYEEALTELVSADKGYYNLGAHYLWIGDRTRQIEGAHVEYFRGIRNPIGVKCGPSMTESDLVELVKILNPMKEEGRLTIITRYGVGKVSELLPVHIRAVKSTGIPVVWCCDPCHGNTISTENGTKTRPLSSILGEIVESFRVHKEEGSVLGGVHLELTGENVTECIGGSDGLMEVNLCERYETFCDPRLNHTQSLDVAFLVARELAQRKQQQQQQL